MEKFLAFVHECLTSERKNPQVEDGWIPAGCLSCIEYGLCALHLRILSNACTIAESILLTSTIIAGSSMGGDMTRAIGIDPGTVSFDVCGLRMAGYSWIRPCRPRSSPRIRRPCLTCYSPLRPST
jgi:hypothetical protein